MSSPTAEASEQGQATLAEASETHQPQWKLYSRIREHWFSSAIRGDTKALQCDSCPSRYSIILEWPILHVIGR